MRTAAKILGAFVLVLVLVAAGALAWLHTTLPRTQGSMALEGLDAPVDIARDRWGIPRITAQSEQDAYFALGYVHAQDRLWQMETLRRVGAGRLSEIFGERTLQTDRMMRMLGLYRLAENTVALLDEEVREALEAYAAGVNAFIAQGEGSWRAHLPPEFLILRHKPEPWRPADTLVWGRLMGMQLAGNWREELLRTELARILPPERIADLWAEPEIREQAHLEGIPAAQLLAALPEAIKPRLASNVWALSGDRTTTGAPILANDPHLGFSAPNLWYLASIEAPGLSVTGATVPGVPFHLLGHNGHIAWGITTTHSDTMDLFVERSAGQDLYETPDGPQPLDIRNETIHVRNGPPVQMVVRHTRNGPLVSDVLGPRTDDALLALSAAQLQPDDLTPQAIYRLNRARDWEEFTEALREFLSPQQNFFFASVTGDIGFYVPGRVPLRRSGDGTLPQPGWTGEADWVGWVPFEELPHAFNPAGGVVLNANNRITPPGYPHLITAHWPEPFRAERIRDVLAALPRHDMDGTIQLQHDALSGLVERFRPLLLSVEPDEERERNALRMIAEWDGVMARESAAALIFQTWINMLYMAVIEDDLGDQAAAMALLRPVFLENVLRTNSSWCDDIRTLEREDCATMIRRSLTRSLEQLTAAHGQDMTGWRWGAAHRARFDHPVFAQIPVIGRLTEIAPATDGDDFTVNRGTYSYNRETGAFPHLHGAGFRAVYDLSDLGNSRYQAATGQSGNPLSSHWQDLTEDWAEGRMITISSTDPAERVLRLEPAQ